MEMENKQLSKSTQSWIKRIERKDPSKLDYHSELRNWMKCVIMQAEKDKDFKKKNQFAIFLEDLETSET
ncbi:MAG: hypothetical protein QXN36_08240 [Candidatus Bathyarchaeia archaeon]